MNIFEDIKKKNGLIKALAPMEDVTDSVFRQMLCEIGRPDIFFTEFMNVDGYCSEGKEKVTKRIFFEQIERPVVVQLWGNNPDNYLKTVSEIVRDIKPDGIDINMGCSVRDVLKIGGGSALIKDKELSREIIAAVKENAQDIPVSVKTRIGYDELDFSWIEFLLGNNLDMLTVHGRLAKEGYATPSRWDIFTEIINFRDNISPTTLILGNGDIQSMEQGKEYVDNYNIDGYMVGRGILANPWLFSGREEISKEERVKMLLKHMEIYEKIYRDQKHFYTQKKYVKAYINGFDGANALREDIMQTESVDQLKSALEKYGT